MSRQKNTVILKLQKTLTQEEYKALYFELRKQIWSGVLMLPPDIEFLGVSDQDADLVVVTTADDILAGREVSG